MLRAVVACFLLGCGGDPKPQPTTPAPSNPQPPPPAATEDKATLAELQVKRLAFEGYPSWAVNNPDQECPATVADLAAQTNPSDTKDPWGTDVRMFCGKDKLPAGAKGLAVQSAGADMTFDTADDVKTW